MKLSQNLPPLPKASGSVEVQVLDGGSFTANYAVVHADTASSPFRCHSWVFYIHHRPNERHVIWDVGLSADRSEYTAWNITHNLDVLEPVSASVSLPNQLKKRGLDPDQVDTVLFSHAHWDHCRPVKGMFPNATGYFGPGSFKHCMPGQFHDEPYDLKGRWDANFFHPERATEKAEELKGEWQPFGPFEKALDFFGDGSLWILQAPGHMVGNLAAAARLSNGEWVIMGSDCCHSKQLLDGTADFKTWVNACGHTESLHEDLDAARETVKRIKSLEADYGAHVALAHDSTWMLAGKDDVLMSLLDNDLRDFANTTLPVGGFP